MSEKTGRKYRLLSESEWEYAARGGTETEFWWGNDDKINQPRYAVISSSGHFYNGIPAEQLISNPYGIYAMNGNLSEWVQDCRFNTLEGIPVDGSARIGSENCDFRVVRGGHFKSGLRNATSSAKLFIDMQNLMPRDYIGLRIATVLSTEQFN